MLSKALRSRASMLLARRAQSSAVVMSNVEKEAQKTGDYTKVERLEDWENFKMPAAPYENMGPLPPNPTEIPIGAQSRMFWFPEPYFKMLEPHIGYTGPYVLLWGGLIAGLSKELIVECPEFHWAWLSAVIVGAGCHHLAGPFWDREDKIMLRVRDEQINAWKAYKMSLAESEVDGVARLKEQSEGLKLVQQQRKTNLKLALDAEYLNRQASLASAVKKRLDYQLSVANAEREAMSKHMVGWVEKEVKAAIAKRPAKEDLAAAIAQLKQMAKAN